MIFSFMSLFPTLSATEEGTCIFPIRILQRVESAFRHELSRPPARAAAPADPESLPFPPARRWLRPGSIRPRLRRCDPSQTDHGNLHGPGALVDHSQRNRLDSGAGQPAGDIVDPRHERFGVDGHRQKRVRNGQRVGPGIFRRPRHFGDIRHVRRKLDDQRAGACAP